MGTPYELGGTNTGVIISKLSENYWHKYYYSSGRIISDTIIAKCAMARSAARSRSQKRAAARSA